MRKIDINTIYNENCLDTIRDMPDNFVDYIITSPPYNIGNSTNKGKGKKGSKKYENIVETAYRKIRGISVDYGVMEKSHDVYVIKGKFGWSDVGSWDEVYRISGKDENGNTVTGQAFLQGAKNSFIHAGEKFVAAIGVDDLIIVAADDAVLVCKKGQSQDVKEVVDFLRRKQKAEFL